MIKIENLHVEVEGNKILKGINLEVKTGETHAIMGPNGSGKSTLAQVLAGHDDYEVTMGNVEYLGKNLFIRIKEDIMFWNIIYCASKETHSVASHKIYYHILPKLIYHISKKHNLTYTRT